MHPSSHSSHLSSYPYSSSVSSSHVPSSRLSSHHLRSTFSTPSTSAYVTRTHLPFAPQSTLVAHCIAGVQSSTKPYGSSPSYRSSSSSSSGFLSSSSLSSHMSISSRPSSIRSKESGNTILYRPSSIKRIPSSSSYISTSSTRPSSYLSTDSYSSSNSNYRYNSPSSFIGSRSSYLSTSNGTRGSYRSTYSPSSYAYRPVRLRERPLLTHIRHQLNESKHSSYSRTDPSKSESETKSDTKNDNTAIQDSNSTSKDTDWSSDVTRNISRNKYLIKFREFDRRQSTLNLVKPNDKLDDKYESEIQKLELKPEVQTDSSTKPNDHQESGPETSDSSQNIEHKEIIIQSEIQSESIHLPSEKKELIVPEEKEMRIIEKEPTVLSATVNPLQVADGKSVEKLEPKRVERIKKGVVKQKKLDVTTSVGSDIKPEPVNKRTDTGVTTDMVSSSPIAKPPCYPVEDPKKVNPVKVDTEKSTETQAKSKPRNIKLKLKPVVNSESKFDEQKDVDKTDSTQVSNKTVISSEKVEAKQQKSKQQNVNASCAIKQTIPSSGPESPTKTKVKRLVKDKQPKVATTTQGTDNKTQEQQQSDATTKPKALGTKKVVVSKAKVMRDTEKSNEKISKENNQVSKPVVVNIPIEIEPREQETTKPKIEETKVPPIPTTVKEPVVAEKRIRFRQYGFEDFDFLSVLGHGGWGFVILAELKNHDAYFAVKCIKKITIVEDDDFESIMIERKVLLLGNINPYICKLFCTFETDGYLFFVMEFCPGGDLMFHVQREGKFTESRCRFYAAEIICAIRFLHNRHIIYRDLKLDNILLDASGHVRLVDFGMCQCRTYREEMLPSNFCGTPEYISPEIIKGVPYNHSVDWWSFGVLLYEMAVGKMPFRGNDENELLWNVCYEKIHYPMFLTKELTQLLQLLLEREPTKRMGMSTCKSGDIKDQVWFRGVDWPAMEAMRVKPPFVPQVISKRDVQNFDTDFTESAPELSPVDESTLKRIDQKQFQKFPYTNPDIHIFESATS